MLKLLLSVTTIAILFLGCNEDTKEEVKATANKTIDSVAKTTENMQETSNKAIEKAAEKTKQVINSVIKNTAPVVDEVTTKAEDVVEDVTKATKDLQEKIHTATAPKVDGKTLYKVCGSCHGQNGEKKALNASAVIQGWSKEKVKEALHGYKAGTYGGAMKGVMLGQVNNLDDEKIEALASYISSL